MAKEKITTRGPLFCRKEMKGKGPAGKTSPRYCPECKHKIRGPNHAEGFHHKNPGQSPKSRGY